MYRIDLGLKAKILGWLLVTAGGTRVPCDGVRNFGNDSEGGTGVEIVNAAVDRGVQTILLCNELTELKYKPNKQAKVYHYKTYDEYNEQLARIAKEYNICYAISAAAVSDFGFERVAGKIKSKNPVLPQPYVLPKVLKGFRELFGKQCYCVGFKLEDHPRNVLGRPPTPKEWRTALDVLLAEADEQVKDCRLNLTVANFAPWGNNPDKKRGKRRMWLRRPDGGGMELFGTGRQVATKLVDYILEQADVTWGRSTRLNDDIEVHRKANDLSFDLAGKTLEFAKTSGLLHGNAGNVTVMAEMDHAWVTPRGVDKRTLTENDLCYVTMPSGQDTELTYSSEKTVVKPSIDSRVYLKTYLMFPFAAAIHFHDAWVLNPDAVTKQDFACGTNKAAGELIAAITRTKANNEPLMIELVRHGHTLFLTDSADLAVLRQLWREVKQAYLEHLSEVGMSHILPAFQLMPIFNSTTIVGVAAKHKTEGWHSFFLAKDERGSGLGAKLVALINERQVNVGVHRDCQVKGFYVDRGFETIEEREDEGLTIFSPPILREELRRAATIRVVCPTEQTIFLGLRSADFSYPNLACNLGGGIEKDKESMIDGDPHTMLDLDAWDEAVRELKDECGVDLSHLPRPERFSIHYTRTVRNDGSEVVTQVTCFEQDVPWQFFAEPRTKELDFVGWFRIDSLHLLPRGHATKETHRDLEARYTA